jgi:antitoxin ParD1/3/4
MGKNTSVVLGDVQEAFLKSQVNSGRYGSVSEAVRDGIALLEERELRLQALRRAIDDGDASGDFLEVDIEQYLVESAA